MNKNYHDITLALAGIIQSAVLVRDLAKTGKCNNAAFQASIDSIYRIETPTVAAVYDGTANLRMGLNVARRIFSKQDESLDKEVARYVLSLIQLERDLAKSREPSAMLEQRIKHVITQVNFFTPNHPQVFSSLADIYIKTIGTLKHRIRVIGRPAHIESSDILNKIRAVLLAGIRAAVLWRQVGGNRWQLLFSQNKLVGAAKELITNSIPV